MDTPQVNSKTMEQLSDGRVRLHGAGTRKGVGGGVGLLIFAAIWNSITWIVVLNTGSEPGATNWSRLGFFSIFVLIGLVILVGGIWTLARALLVGGKILPAVLTIDRLPLRLGEEFKVAYEQRTRKQCEINKVTVTLTCLEWVQYTVHTGSSSRRTSRRTVEHTVSEQREILTENVQARGAELIKGEAKFAIAAEAMHSFDSSHNKIKWFLKVHTDIVGWPDYSDKLAIAVAPRIMEDRA